MSSFGSRTGGHIESRHNPKFRIWLSLLEAKGIKKQGLALVTGRKIVDEILSQNPKLASDLLLPEKFGTPSLPSHIGVHTLAKPLFQALDVFGTRSPLLVVKTPTLSNWKNSKPEGLSLIVALSDPGNLGALLRSAEAFGAQQVILSQESCSPFLPKSIRASSGACFRLPLLKTGSLDQINDLKGYSLNMSGANIGEFAWPKNLYLVLGEEGQGVPEDLKLTPIAIPMQGQIESLNATTAAAIAMFSYSQKHGSN